MFQYASENIDTGIAEIDAFETLKTFTTNTTRSPVGEVTSITVTSQGSGYTSVPTVSFTSGSGIDAAATAVLGSGTTAGKVVRINITNPGTGYQVAPSVNITGGGGSNAAATASIDINIDKVNSFGDNNKFKTQSQDVLFSVTNPFGEIDNTNNP